jgi:hypothetical protein
MFQSVSNRFVTPEKSMQTWPNWCNYCTNSLKKVSLEFFTTNAPNPLHGTQNSCFVAFRTFRHRTKVDAKLTELVPLTHKFAKQSRVGIFRNEHTQSTPLDPKLMFWVRFGPFRYSTKVDAKQAELVPLTPKFAKQCRVGIFRNERKRSTPLDPKLIFRGISNHFVTPQKSIQTWPNWCCYRTNSLNKVALEFFATNPPDPLHGTQNSCFVAFRTFSSPYESRCKTDRTGAINAQVR